MLGNLVNRHDFIALYAKIARDGWRSVVRRLRLNTRQRVEETWADTDDVVDQWWAVDAVQRRWRRMVTGRDDEPLVRYLSGAHLAPRTSLRGLSLGCGTGWRLVEWLATGRFASIDAFDLSPARIAAARRSVADAGVADVVRLSVADVRDLALPEHGYDVVIAEQVLHHLAPVRVVLQRVYRTLAPDGLLVIDEYIGPNRNQWTPRQLQAANALLAIMPERYRVTPDGGLKTSVVRASRLRMILRDPSEAVESERILPVVHELFEVVEARGYGGALLHPLLSRIAHNFADADPDGQALLDLCFRAEDMLLQAGEIVHDFIIAVCRRRNGVAR
jgi:2-polyprenyl-3-methyl-5-hydroxy-6-metoxy-1,4-benzoquinol methylase